MTGSPVPNSDHPETSPTPQTLGSQLVPLWILTGIFYLNFIARVIPAPLIPVMETDLNFGHGEAGFFFFLISTGFFIGMLGSAFLPGRATHRQLILISTCTMALTLMLASYSTNLWQIRLAMLFVGLTSGVYLPSAMPTLTSLIRQDQWGKAISIHELAPNLAFISAPAIAELLMNWWSWRSVLLFLGGTTLLATCAFAFYGTGGDFSGRRLTLATIKPLVVRPAFWGIMVLFGFGISSTMGVYSMMPLFLMEEHGMDRTAANNLLAISRASTVISVLIGGWASDRFGTERTMGVTLLLSGIITALLGATSGNWLLLFFFLQPMVAVCFFPAAYTAVLYLAPPETRNIAIALTLPTAYVIGAGLIPAGIGFLGNHGLFSEAFVLQGCLILSCGILCHRRIIHFFMPLCKNLNR